MADSRDAIEESLSWVRQTLAAVSDDIKQLRGEQITREEWRLQNDFVAQQLGERVHQAAFEASQRDLADRIERVAQTAHENRQAHLAYIAAQQQQQSARRPQWTSITSLIVQIIVALGTIGIIDQIVTNR